MTIEGTLARVEAIRQTLADPALLVEQGTSLTGGVEAPRPAGVAAGSSFADALANASGDYEGSSAGASAASGVYAGAHAPSALAPSPGFSASVDIASPYAASLPSSVGGIAGTSSLVSMDGGGAGGRIVAIAESQLGQAEQPPGSNESPAIAQYRSATAGAAPGEPWCAYFASWAARMAGAPIGAEGQGIGSAAGIWSWAQGAGRAIPNGPGVVPKPGDLIVFGSEHVGVVRDVLPNGEVQTIEGNYENKVAANVRTPTEATGYVEVS